MLLEGWATPLPRTTNSPGRAIKLVARRLNPARATKVALGTSGRAAKSVVVKLHPRRLARAAREFRRIGAGHLPRLARGVGRGSKGVAGRLRVISPRKARSVRVVATAVRKLVENIDPAAATRIAREATRLARKTIVKLDPHRVEAAVRRVAETIDVDGKGKMDTVAKAAVAKIGPERATRIAGAATRAIKRLVDRLDPDHVGQVIGDLVAQPELRSAQHTGDRVNLHCFPECRDALDAATWRNPRDLHGKNFASRPSTW